MEHSARRLESIVVMAGNMSTGRQAGRHSVGRSNCRELISGSTNRKRKDYTGNNGTLLKP